MNSPKALIIILFLIAGLLSACGSQPTDAPASAAQPTQASTDALAPTDTAVIPTEASTSQPTEAPATDSGAQTAAVSFTNDVQPILESRCVNCHGGDRTEKGLVMRSYAELMAGSENGLVITPGDAENSLLADLIATQKMPKRGPKLSPPQVQIIFDWINQGALDN